MKLGEMIDFTDIDGQGERHIEVILQDKMTGRKLGKKLVKRSLVAKAFHEYRVIGSVDGKFVVEV